MKKEISHVIHWSVGHSTRFKNQKDMAEALGISTATKKAISNACRNNGYGVQFDDNNNEYDVDINHLHRVSRYECITALKQRFPGNNPGSWSKNSTKQLAEWYAEYILNDVTMHVIIF